MRRLFAALFFIFSFVSVYSQNTIDLKTESEKNGIEIYWDSLSSSGILEKNGHQISFRVGDDFIIQDFRKISFVDSPEMTSGAVTVSSKFVQNVLDYFKSVSEENGFKIGAILIDPGHGGKDPGAIATHKIKGENVTIREKDINLTVGKMLYSSLKSAYPDKNIKMTRDKDVFLELSQRTEIANSIKLKDHEAILYISIHVNSSLDRKASGYEVWYLSPETRRTVIDKNSTNDKDLFSVMNSMMEEEFTQESILIAKFIMDGIQAQVGEKIVQRGIKAEDWFVVKNSNMPAVLVEVGFLTNETEAKNLNDNLYLQKVSQGIFNGLSAFVTHFERSRGFTEAK